MPLFTLVRKAPCKNIIMVKIPGFGLRGAEPGPTLESHRAARGRREPLVLAEGRLLTADTLRCKRPSFQPFPSGKGRDTVSPGHCHLPGGDSGRNSWVSQRGAGAPAGSTSPLGPFWASGLF